MKSFLFFLSLVMVSMPAYAVAVRNLSGQPQVLEVEHGGQQFQVTIEDGKLYRRYGEAISINLPGNRPRFTENYEEYTIWQDGTLAIQRINQSKGLSR